MKNPTIHRISHKFSVSCYSGYKNEQRPISFVFGTLNIQIEKILRQWRDEHHDCFKVRSPEKGLFLLSYSRDEDCWEIQQLNRDKT